MWAIIIALGSLVLAFVFSLAKISSRGEKITEQHRQELLERKNEEM